MKISSIRYTPIEGGSLGGHFALHVILGSKDKTELPDLDSSAIATKIHDAFEILGLKTTTLKGVLIDARDNSSIESEEMLSLLGTLRDWNIERFAWVGEKKRAAWFEFLNHLVVFVKSQHWANFRVSEIRYAPDDDKWIEPDVFEVNRNALLYVTVKDTSIAGKILPFVTDAKNRWGVIGFKPEVQF